MDLTTYIPIPLILAIVEVFKQLGLPKQYVKVSAFMLAALLGILLYWNKEWLQMVLNIAIFACGSAGLYDLTLKPVKSLFVKKPVEVTPPPVA